MPARFEVRKDAELRGPFCVFFDASRAGYHLSLAGLRMGSVLVLVLALWMGVGAVFADEGARSLADLSLEELLNQSVTSVSKEKTRLAETPAAVTVITQEDIHRAGALNIAEALRLAPGLEVARVDANAWAVSSRGFNSLYSNKLLVLQDGRSVYSPLFAGVQWDVQDTVLEDIDRIEVIRGPGATLWGANAVNGVINIITKSAKDTQGTLITGGSGSREPGVGAIRYGGKINDDTFYRVYAKYFDRSESVEPDGSSAYDRWNSFRSGFRIDGTRNSDANFTLQGDFYTGKSRTEFPTNAVNLTELALLEEQLLGGNILGRWERSFSETSELRLQTYFDHMERRAVPFSQRDETLDTDAQYSFNLGANHHLVSGLGYRLVVDHGLGGTIGTFRESSRNSQIFSAFVQDEWTLIDDRLKWIIGTKLEHFDSVGFELEPGTRLLFTPSSTHTLWASVARAARTPSRFEEDFMSPQAHFVGLGGPTVLELFGNGSLKSEHLTAYEFGYRSQLTHSFSAEIAAFYNDYSHLRTFETGNPLSFAPPYTLIPIIPENLMKGEAYGAELTLSYRIHESVRLEAGYTWLEQNLHLAPTSNDTQSEVIEGDAPKQQFHFRTLVDLPHRIQWDTTVYFVDRLVHHSVPSYVRLDARLGWRPVERLELSLEAQNLLDSQHREFARSIGIGATEIPRSVFGRITWNF